MNIITNFPKMRDMIWLQNALETIKNINNIILSQQMNEKKIKR